MTVSAEVMTDVMTSFPDEDSRLLLKYWKDILAVENKIVQAWPILPDSSCGIMKTDMVTRK